MQANATFRKANLSLRKSAALIAASALLLTVSACSPAQPEDGQLKTDSYEMSMADWRQDMDGCFLDAGFDISGGEGGPEGGSGSVDTTQFDMEAFDRVAQACSKEVGEPPVDESQPTDDEIFESQLIFAKCMRDAGFDFPDPVKGGMTSALGPETDPDVVDKCSEQSMEQVN